MTDRSKQVKVGIFAVVTAGLLAVVLLVFGGIRFWKHHDHYYVIFDDTVLGLEPGASVTLNGIPVGTVDSVAIAPDDLDKVRVGLTVDVDTPIRADTHAFLSMAGLTGVRSVDLKGGSYKSPRIAENGPIPMGLGTLDKLQAKAEMLADESGKLMQRANEIADGASRVMTNLTTATDPAAVQAILASTQRATANLDAASRGVVAIVGETKSMVGETKSMIGETKTELARTLQAVSGAATSATALLDSRVGGFVDNANSLVTDLRGVVHGNEAVLTAATADIRQAARSFKELSREVREKPSRLLFSGNQPDRKLP